MAESRAGLDRLETNLDRYATESRASFDRHAAVNDKLFADLAASIDRANRESGEAPPRAPARRTWRTRV